MHGEKIKEYRKNLEMTQNQLAENLGVSRNTVARWEMNAVKPDSWQMLELALKHLIFEKNKKYSRQFVEETYQEITQNLENTRRLFDEMDEMEKNRKFERISPRLAKQE